MRDERSLPRVIKAQLSDFHQALRPNRETQLAQSTAGYAVIAAVRPDLEL